PRIRTFRIEPAASYWLQMKRRSKSLQTHYRRRRSRDTAVGNVRVRIPIKDHRPHPGLDAGGGVHHQLLGAGPSPGGDICPGGDAGDAGAFPLGWPGAPLCWPGASIAFGVFEFGVFAAEFCEMVTTPWLLSQVVVGIVPASTCLAFAVISAGLMVTCVCDIPVAAGAFAFAPLAVGPFAFGSAPQSSPAIWAAVSTLRSRSTLPFPMVRFTS